MISGPSARRSLLSLAELSADEISTLGDLAFRYGQASDTFAGRLAGMRAGLVFTAPSTRTRTSFWSAAVTLGCEVLHLGQSDLQISTGETWSDTGSMLANLLDVVVARTNGPQRDLVDLAAHVPTINALTHEEHPTQAIADLVAMREHFGSIENLRLAYLGEVHNTARALALLASKLPFARLDVYSPEGGGFESAELESLNAVRGAEVVRQHHELPATPPAVDIVYATRWQSMGAARQDGAWLSRFAPFAIADEVMRRFSGPTEAVFMHDLPAVRGQEVTSDVLDGVTVTSLVQRQAFHKASAAAAALLWSIGAS
ncbi:ornithine carbamoyltransferase [Pilimelia terevasa]|uniref:Ornithine carbamoyltransferase n=1 Tax=Pilimelia terevasa TaxID=53372 RepID=A0A8J3FK79_9ACTN|nr:ornithine carbamoyltransferase [Pilimelia terevasa]GGK43400.1 ornithine carbamoyltransferase [Pilimelia terevasa]